MRLFINDIQHLGRWVFFGILWQLGSNPEPTIRKNKIFFPLKIIFSNTSQSYKNLKNSLQQYFSYALWALSKHKEKESRINFMNILFDFMTQQIFLLFLSLHPTILLLHIFVSLCTLHIHITSLYIPSSSPPTDSQWKYHIHSWLLSEKWKIKMRKKI